MNLTPHTLEKDMDQLRTEQVQKKKNEFHLIGQERRIKGHTLFCFNLVKREIKVAPMNQEIEMVAHTQYPYYVISKELPIYDALCERIEWLIKEGYFNKEYLEE